MDYRLNSTDGLTQTARNCGINSWLEITRYVKDLPYGRNKNRFDLSLVLIEKKGTCSSKHALLKNIAYLNKIPNVELLIGIYKINEINTPKIGNELSKNSLDFIPEAHCYLKINGERIDFTTKKSEFKNIEKDILLEKEIDPSQVAEFKVQYHKNFIYNWLKETKSKLNFESVWRIREQCIKNLSE